EACEEIADLGKAELVLRERNGSVEPAFKPNRQLQRSRPARREALLELNGPEPRRGFAPQFGLWFGFPSHPGIASALLVSLLSFQIPCTTYGGQEQQENARHWQRGRERQQCT